ncbi:MFS transporter [Pseudonocardia humida]|uniref:MFS transporter n=1 Tax=Pseudonocardia humida TaxID=2800819 RepID=A0ABT0ZUZ8_9PSEU|nr:MFS transporter [Pseudonocardia humida]MCO1654546.1 MFS transporter [Pseudonocardia humida]
MSLTPETGPPDALAEPTRRVGAGWIGAFSLAWVGLHVGLFGAIQILLPQQTEALAPADKEAALAVVLGFGAAFSLVANPLFGALSDRTTSRWGRRAPWMAIGFVGGAVALGVLAVSPTITVVIIGWCLAQTLLNASAAALSAGVPDQVPPEQRGTAAGYVGLALIVGVAVGTGLAVLAGSTTAGYLACAAFMLIAAVPYLLLRRDTALDPAHRPPWNWGAFLRGFWVDPRRYPDFGWAWLTRFLINLGNSIALLYLFFYLKDAVGVPDPATGVLIATAVDLGFMLIAVVLTGMWSDRVGRRRVFVTGGGLLMAGAAFTIAVWPTWTGVLVAAAVLGLGFGTYTSVDFALLTQVLPSSTDRARDLGVLNIASSLPQVIAPVVAAPIVTGLGGYPVLYGVAGAVGLAGAVLVFRIRSVR